jgi:hypothetical protein
MDMETNTNERAVQAAWEFARREAKGLPVDRLGNDQDMHLVAEGIRVLWGTCEALWAEKRAVSTLQAHDKRE